MRCSSSLRERLLECLTRNSFNVFGLRNMISEAVKKLIEDMGYLKGPVHYELYG